jgi:hypothetical protein
LLGTLCIIDTVFSARKGLLMNVITVAEIKRSDFAALAQGAVYLGACQASPCSPHDRDFFQFIPNEFRSPSQVLLG